MAKGDSSKCTLKVLESSSVFTDVKRIIFKLVKESGEFGPHCLSTQYSSPKFIMLAFFFFLLNRDSIYSKAQQLES